jgi:phage terminase Nu1 subunit (DNA packaging protein)
MAVENWHPSVLDGFAERKQLAKDLRRCERTIKRWEDQGLPVIRRGKMRLYDIERVRAWLRGEDKQRRRP